MSAAANAAGYLFAHGDAQFCRAIQEQAGSTHAEAISPAPAASRVRVTYRRSIAALKLRAASAGAGD